MPKLSWNKPVSSGYEKTLRKKNMQLTELQFYINNIARCLDIVDLLSTRRQYHQFNTFKIVLLSYKSVIYKPQSLWYFPITSEHITIKQNCKVYWYRKYFIFKYTILTVQHFNKWYTFWQVNNQIIQQASDILSISDQYIVQNSPSLWSSIDSSMEG